MYLQPCLGMYMYPCEWNRPNKKRKDTKPVQNMSFKKIKLSGENVKNKKPVNYKVDSIKFRNSLCEKLGNNSRAAIFYILLPCANNNIDVQSDLNIAHFKKSILMTTFFTFLTNILHYK